MKKILLFIFAVMFAGQVWAENFNFFAVCSSGQTLYYKITSSTEPYTVAVTCPDTYSYYSGYSKPTGNIVIPDTVNYCGVKYAVKSIGEYAFYQCSDLTSVTIPEPMKRIGQLAFAGCSSLTTATISESVKSIGGGAFWNCYSLKSITLSFGDESNPAFFPFGQIFGISDDSGSEYGYYEIKQWTNRLSNTSTYNARFSSSLKDVTITGSHIPYRAFYNCHNLTSVHISSTVTNIKKEAFYGCTRLLKNYDNATYVSNDENSYYALVEFSNAEICEINENCKIIADEAFSSCDNLKTLIISESVRNIGKNAFEECTNLESVEIPNSVVKIDDYVFSGCDKLASITIGDALVDIGNYAFNNCTCLNSISFGNSVKNIGNYAFYNCTGLNSITIGDSVKTIGEGLFYGCTGLTSVTIPNSITNVGKSVFYACSNLVSVTFGESVASIDAEAFGECANLKVITCMSPTPPTLTNDPFTNVDTIYVPVRYVNTYKTAPIWKRKTILPINIAVSADNTMGTVSCTANAGNDNITVTAVPTANYHFVNWSDGSTDNPHETTSTEPGSLTAYFAAHTEVTDAAIAATCTAIGLTTGKHCSVCGKTTVPQQEVPKLAHTAVVDIAAVAPTCTTDGLTERTHCSICNTIISEQTIIPALGHTAVTDAAVAPTCAETGKTEGSHCSICNTILVPQNTIPANGHIEIVDAAVAPTCTEIGKTEGKHCLACGKVLIAQEVISAKGHTVVTDAAITPTVTSTGLTAGAHCSVCGAVIVAQEVIPALGEQGGNTNPATTVSESAVNAINIYAHGNTIIVENAAEEIRVYNAMGALVGRDSINRVRTEIPVNGTGVYLVKVGNVAKRVMVN